MAYTAWEKVRKINVEKYGINAPQQPKLFTENDEYTTKLEEECLAFIREDCEGLRFNPMYAECVDSEGDSIGKKQIPYNMEKDTDRLCFERAISTFMETGLAENAFDVYFCYLEMFIGKYCDSKKMIEMLAEFEMNASSLLMKHRDHYSHSVYVFVLGLAIYHNNAKFRENYRLTHMNGADVDEHEVAHHFLKYWGLTSLFHDIGYPFELPFEQVKSYFGDTIKGVPFVSYEGMKEYTAFSEEEKAHFKNVYESDYDFKSITDLLAYSMNLRLGEEYGCTVDYLRDDVMDLKPVSPDAFGGFMDHAVFSGVILYKQLVEVLGVTALNKDYIDSISAIVLHNSMFKFSVRNGKPLPMKTHPLAYMLMLCDELQCWDRTSYGRNSRQQLHPMWFDMTFEGEKIKAIYFYDDKYEAKKDTCTGTCTKMRKDVEGYSKDVKFIHDIEEIIELNIEGSIELEMDVQFESVKKLRKLNTYLSSSNFIHLYNFAVLVHGRRKKVKDPNVTFEELEKYFNESTLEYQLSVIWRTRNYGKYLDAVGLFYTDKPVIYEMVDKEDVDDKIEVVMGEMEHLRWNEDKLSLGWCYGNAYADKCVGKDGKLEDDKALRERTRTHKDIVEYEELDEEAKDKDKEPLREMLPLLAQMDGIRIYKIPGARGM